LPSSSLSDRLLALKATVTAGHAGSAGSVALKSIPDYNPLLVYPMKRYFGPDGLLAEKLPGFEYRAL
jgi:hypothetical protein